MVRCKMRVTEKLNRVAQYGDGRPTCHVRISAVSDEANKAWAKYTPVGTTELQIDNPDAYEAFELGKCCFVDFQLAPATEAEEKR